MVTRTSSQRSHYSLLTTHYSLLTTHYSLLIPHDSSRITGAAMLSIMMLTQAGLRLAFLSNMTPKMLDAAISNAGLEGAVEHRLSTDAVQAYKPDPRAYQMGVDAFRLAREQILFAAFGGWDAAGAKGFGYPTFWVNRLGLPVEELGVVPDAVGGSLTDLVTFVQG